MEQAQNAFKQMQGNMKQAMAGLNKQKEKAQHQLQHMKDEHLKQQKERRTYNRMMSKKTGSGKPAKVSAANHPRKAERGKGFMNHQQTV